MIQMRVLITVFFSATALVGWSLPTQAVTEISNFHELEFVKVDQLTARLTEGDPRWDPWLTGLLNDPRPAATLHPVFTRPRILAGILFTATAVLVGFFLLLIRSRRSSPWASVAVCASIALVLLIQPFPEVSGSAPTSGLYRQHLWYQQAFPYGLTWLDYAPGKAITQPAYRRDGGKLTAVTDTIFGPGEAWEDQWFANSPELNAVRLLNIRFP